MGPAAGSAIDTASWARRIVALLVDWTACTLVVLAFIGLEEYGEPGSPAQWYTLGVYVLESALFTWLLGGSFGKLLTRLRVVPAEGPVRPINPLRLLTRQIGIALVIPPLVFRSDGRGFHDLFAGTATVTLPTYLALRGA